MSSTGSESPQDLVTVKPKRAVTTRSTKSTNIPPSTAVKRRQNNNNDISNTNSNNKDAKKRKPDTNNSNNTSLNTQAGHRPVTSCTHCRQHKIKCNASERFPQPCSRCERMSLKCEIDPQFRPKKGSQIQSLKNDVDELRSKIEYLTRNEKLMAQVLQNRVPVPNYTEKSPSLIIQSNTNNNISPSLIAKTHLKKEPTLLSLDGRSNSTPLINDSALDKSNLNPALEAAVRKAVESPAQFNGTHTCINTDPITTSSSNNGLLPNVTTISEFSLGNVKIDITKAEELHKRFIDQYLPYLPIMISNSCLELYQQSQLLFWTVMLTACSSDPDPTLYNSLSSLIKQLAIETCWIRTPRSTHIVQSLLILATWPLPNKKVLDDSSYRFIGLAKNLGFQLGLHRGKFMSEFTRTQVSLPDAETWRSRTWLVVFFCEQFWCSNLGLAPSLSIDYIVENATSDLSLPKNLRCLISLSIFQAKLVNIMGLNVTSPDGLMEPMNRAGPLNILERELERLASKLEIDDLTVEIYYHYVRLMLCLFSFMPLTPSEDQIKYVTIAYNSATRIVTIFSKLSEQKQLIEYPIYVRHSVTTAAFVLFRLHLTPYLLPKYIDSARQSIVTVHRLYRNMLAAWKDVENDISRTATVLEKLNFVIVSHPELYVGEESEGIIVRMRSHLTGSLFYDLVWNIHEARRRTVLEQQNKEQGIASAPPPKLKRKPLPLPFYNQITKDDFTAITSTTPNGTTVTTLVPTDQAITNAKMKQKEVKEINGIPLVMLEATGAVTVKPNSNGNNGNGSINNNNNVNNNSDTKNNKQQQGIPSSILTPISLKPKTSLPLPLPLASLSKKPSNQRTTRNSSAVAAAENGITPSPLFPPRGYSSVSLNESANKGMSPLTSLNAIDNLFDTPTFGVNDFNKDTNSRPNSRSGSTSPSGHDTLNELVMDTIFQQQQQQDLEPQDDLLGWFDMNMVPEF